MLHKWFKKKRKIAAIVNLHVKYVFGIMNHSHIYYCILHLGFSCILAADLWAKVSSNYFYEAVNGEGTLSCEPWRGPGWDFWETVYFLSEDSETVSGRSEVKGNHSCCGSSWESWMKEQHFSLCVCVCSCVWRMSTFFCFSVFCKDGSWNSFDIFCVVPQTEKKKMYLPHIVSHIHASIHLHNFPEGIKKR